jgi:Asp-tRNA(Asn)/Glu-tRNA(Gln) amidotransferase A subunit family amidase
MSNYANRFPENKSSYLGHTRISVELTSVIGTKDYVRAQQVRKQAMDQLHTVFKKRKIDLLMTPTTAITAPEITKDALKYGISDMKQLGFCTAFTTLANFTGVPAVSVPFGYHQGLPIGLQFIGAWYNEALLLRIAKACESLEENERQCPEHWFSKDLL